MRAIVADDTALLREGVSRILESAGIEVVGKAADAEDLMRKVRAHKPDVAIVDIRMPPDNTDDGLRAAVAIRAELPDTGVLVLSQYVEEEYAVELVAASAERGRLPPEGSGRRRRPVHRRREQGGRRRIGPRPRGRRISSSAGNGATTRSTRSRPESARSWG